MQNIKDEFERQQKLQQTTETKPEAEIKHEKPAQEAVHVRWDGKAFHPVEGPEREPKGETVQLLDTPGRDHPGEQQERSEELGAMIEEGCEKLTRVAEGVGGRTQDLASQEAVMEVPRPVQDHKYGADYMTGAVIVGAAAISTVGQGVGLAIDCVKNYLNPESAPGQEGGIKEGRASEIARENQERAEQQAAREQQQKPEQQR